MKKNNLDNAQELGRECAKRLYEGQRPEILIVGLLETIMEYLATILDCISTKKEEDE